MDGKNNITLIGMPGAGKSTIGIILAKYMAFGFIDTDVLIQINYQKSLQQIMDDADYLYLRRIEETEILKINIDRHVIATGGSAVYSEKAMRHLSQISRVVFLKAAYETLEKRIHNFDTRGIASPGTRPFANCMRSARCCMKNTVKWSLTRSLEPGGDCGHYRRQLS
ncbi:MAG: shikimate kinase [Desulfobacterales bacterium]